jgi:hypothetical protein
MRNWIHLVLIAVAVVVAAAFYGEWRSARQDGVRLQAQLSEAEQSLNRANANQQQRDKQLMTTLAQLNSLKSTVNSQQEILAKLPDVLPLPKPLTTLAGPRGSGDSGVQSTTNESKSIKLAPPKTQITAIPTEDLKPMYDFAVDCKACQARLTAATADLADEKLKTQALSRERDAALQAARGGSLRRRLARSAKWFFLGAIAGAVAAKAH